MGVMRFIAAVAASLMFLTSANAQEREWLLDAADQDVFMVFGVPNTNDVGVSFWCRIRKPGLTLFLPLPPNVKKRKVKLKLNVGDKTFALDAVKPVEDVTNTVETKIKDRDDLMSRLKAVDRFTITIAQHKTVYPLTNADIDGFLKLCESPESISN
jgi:hypothetical protein